MKKVLLILAALFIVTMGFSQTQTQKGISYRYNGKNPRTPLPHVTIECETANNAVVSDDTGSFTLTFNNLKMGDRMGLVTVKKREMMVFNQHAVDEWSIRKEPLCLILCDANEFESQKQELINIGKREAQKKYNRQKHDFEKQLEASQIDNAIYEAKLDSAWQELALLHKHIDKYADLFARIDQSEIDTLAQQAMDLFYQGQVDEAVRLFEQGNYLEKLKKAKNIKKQAQEAKANIEKAESYAVQDSIEAVQSLNAQIAAYKIQNEWEKAGVLLKGLADLLETYESLFEYALFCHSQNSYSEAEIYYNKALSICQQKAKDDPVTYEIIVANTLNSIAILYENTKRPEEGETMLKEALDKYRQLAKDDPQTYEPILAITLNNLGSLYCSTRHFEESETMFKEALKIYKQLAKDDSLTYEVGLAATLNNIGGLYSTAHNSFFGTLESMDILEEAVETYRKLSKDDPKTHAPNLAVALNNLGVIYKRSILWGKQGDTLINEALGIYRNLAKNNPRAYELTLANILYNYAFLQSIFTDNDSIYPEAIEAIEIYRRWAIDNPQVYEPDLAIRLYSLAKQHSELPTSNTLRLEAIEIYRRLAKDNPIIYAPVLANVLYERGRDSKLPTSDTLKLEAIDIYRHLAKDNPIIYAPVLANVLYERGRDLFYDKEDYQEASCYYYEALNLCREADSTNPQFQYTYIMTLDQLYNIYKKMDDYAKCYEINEERLPVLKKFFWEYDYVRTLGSQSFYCIFIGQLEKSEQYAREALAIDSTKHWINTNLAAALLLQGKYDEAEAIYRQYKDELKDSFLKDLQDFEAAGVIPEERKADVEKIRKLLNE